MCNIDVNFVYRWGVCGLIIKELCVVFFIKCVVVIKVIFGGYFVWKKNRLFIFVFFDKYVYIKKMCLIYISILFVWMIILLLGFR